MKAYLKSKSKEKGRNVSLFFWIISFKKSNVVYVFTFATVTSIRSINYLKQVIKILIDKTMMVVRTPAITRHEERRMHFTILVRSNSILC